MQSPGRAPHMYDSTDSPGLGLAATCRKQLLDDALHALPAASSRRSPAVSAFSLQRNRLLAYLARALLAQRYEYLVELLRERVIVGPPKLGLDIVVGKVVAMGKFDGVGCDFGGDIAVVIIFALAKILMKQAEIREKRSVAVGIWDAV